MERNNKIQNLKESITELNKLSLSEKNNLLESIEMLWLNASVRKKKKDMIMPDNSNENILRIRQLLAAAWSEDLKE
ncbi:MAG: hypothetical protein CMM90_00365 [Rickettsiales bacterium]|nr:hypothetical protein [Rickettsiales bacterium]|tara:strand:+ start:1306 stop:1533 length:228 start_codon:yes stop_codon:yes gene_type:complete